MVDKEKTYKPHRVLTSGQRQSDRNRLFDAVVRLHLLVAVKTLDLGEYLQLQADRRRAILAEKKVGVLGSSDVSNQARA